MLLGQPACGNAPTLATCRCDPSQTPSCSCGSTGRKGCFFSVQIPQDTVFYNRELRIFAPGASTPGIATLTDSWTTVTDSTLGRGRPRTCTFCSSPAVGFACGVRAAECCAQWHGAVGRARFANAALSAGPQGSHGCGVGASSPAADDVPRSAPRGPLVLGDFTPACSAGLGAKPSTAPANDTAASRSMFRARGDRLRRTIALNARVLSILRIGSSLLCCSPRTTRSPRAEASDSVSRAKGYCLRRAVALGARVFCDLWIRARMLCYCSLGADSHRISMLAAAALGVRILRNGMPRGGAGTHAALGTIVFGISALVADEHTAGALFSGIAGVSIISVCARRGPQDSRARGQPADCTRSCTDGLHNSRKYSLCRASATGRSPHFRTQDVATPRSFHCSSCHVAQSFCPHAQNAPIIAPAFHNAEMQYCSRVWPPAC
mmetsp:Transcript_136528/g.380549  ORF Transcript_136528/g.380549 Transcript_136528/m.380549 type:complete len:435 (+) Transcript_136528:47-1351(+)